jgi:membrane protease YdiL (CAAX protease family)
MREDLGPAVAASTVPWPFFALSYGISWCLWGLALFPAPLHLQPPAVGLLTYLGAFGPFLAAIACAAFAGRPALGRLFRSMFAIRRSWTCYLLALLLMPAAMLAARLLSRQPLVSPAAPPALPMVLLPVLLSVMLAAGLGEETGWRGYALPILLRRMSPPRASLLLGCLWTLWHAPLFFLPDTVQHHIATAPGALLFAAFCLSWTVLFTRLHLASNGSLFLAILFHGTGDFSSVFLQPFESGATFAALVLLMVLAALAPRPNRIHSTARA